MSNIFLLKKNNSQFIIKNNFEWLLQKYMRIMNCQNINDLVNTFIKLITIFYQYRDSNITIKSRHFKICNKYVYIDFIELEKSIYKSIFQYKNSEKLSIIIINDEYMDLLDKIKELPFLKNKSNNILFTYICLFSIFLLENEKFIQIYGKKIRINKDTIDIFLH